MSHPFGDLLTQHLHRKHGLSQARLAAGILQPASIISEMSQGKRLRGPQARERVTAIIAWLQQQGALSTIDEANALLRAAGMASLQERDPAEASLLRKLSTQASAKQRPVADAPPTPVRLPHPMPRHNLLAQLTPFIGRSEQIAQLAQHLQNHRLLTLTGAGGVGKTRLSIEVATRVLANFADGVWFADLTPLTDPQAIPQRILDLWRVPEQPERSPLEALTAYLRTKEALLILDNCEHLIDACAALTETLLQQCPQLSLLATSREALNIGAETPWRVPSLTRPRAESGWEGQPTAMQPAFTPEALAHFEAVTLFVERAAVRQPGFALTTANAPAVALICSRLDGIPLALEMAAARLNLFTVEELATRLDGAFDKRFQLLTSGARTAPPRQQTLRATLEWSYGLLTAKEQWLLVCLSVFSGGWSFAAAEQVTGCSLDQLAQLVNKSLVIADQQGGQTRYRLLETVRQFAYTQLVASEYSEGQPATMVRNRHLYYYMGLAEEIEPLLRGGPQVAMSYAQLEAEHDNLRTAINWALSSGELACGVRIVSTLYHFWVARGYMHEGQTQVERFLAHTAAISAADHARVLITAGGLATYQLQFQIAQPLLVESTAIARELGSNGFLTLARACIELSWTMVAFLDFAAAQRYGQEGLALGQQLADPWLCGEALLVLGAIARDQGDYRTARQHFDAALACCQPLHGTVIYGCALRSLGMLLCDQGDYQAAQIHLTQSVAIFDALSDQLEKAWGILGLGDIAAAQNKLTEAEHYYDQALTIQREFNNIDHAGHMLAALGRLAQRQGNYARSRELLHQSLAIAIKMGNQPSVADALEAIATLTAAQGQAERAARIFGAVEALLRKDNIFLKPILQPMRDRLVATLHDQLGEVAFTTAWTIGTAMELDEVTAIILNG